MPKEAQTYIHNGNRYVLISGDHAFWEKRRVSSLKKVFAGLALAVAGTIPTCYGLNQIKEARASITTDQIAASPLLQQFRFECLGETLKNNAVTLGKKQATITEAINDSEKDVNDCANQKTRQSIIEPKAEFQKATALTIGGFLSLCFGILFMSAKIEDSRKAKEMAQSLQNNTLTPS